MTGQPEQTPLQWPDVPDNILKMLPPVLRAIVRALGISRATCWLKTYGGIYIYLPKIAAYALELTREEIIRMQIALEPHVSAKRIVTIPKADKILAHIRNEQIRADRKNLSLSALARRNNLTTRHIINICNSKPDSVTQAELFEQIPL